MTNKRCEMCFWVWWLAWLAMAVLFAALGFACLLRPEMVEAGLAALGCAAFCGHMAVQTRPWRTDYVQ